MIRKPLGRGLDALIGNASAASAPIHEPAQEGSGITMAPVARIAPAPFQPRLHFDAERLGELQRAIQSQGVIEPLIVRRRPASMPRDGAEYELIAGERRLRAARAAGLETVPVIVRDLDDRAALEISLVENLAREELNPVEEGLAFARLSRQLGQSHEEVAARVGKSRPYVSNAIRLLDLPEPVLAMIARGELSAGQARPLLALGSAEERLSAAERIVTDGLSARAAEGLAAAHRNRGRAHEAGAGGGHRGLDPNMRALEESLQRALKRKVRIIRGRGKQAGRIEIEYYDESDLTALAAALAGPRPGRAG